MRQVINVLIGVVAGFLLAGAVLVVARLPDGSAVKLQPAPTQPALVVHVIGAVVRPAVYEFPEGSRVRDAVEAAGGLLAEADSNVINLAAKLIDGQQLDIPFQAGMGPPPSSSTSPFEVLPDSNPSGDSASLININTATAEQLDTLPGIGPTTAQKIIDYREANGPFEQIEQIMNVAGIGPATFDRIRDLITVGASGDGVP